MSDVLGGAGRAEAHPPEGILPLTEHDAPSGHAHFTLRFVGCIDCATESGMAYTCCRGARCRDCDKTHRDGAAAAP